MAQDNPTYRLLSMSAAARELGVTRQTVRAWVDQGLMRAFTANGRTFIAESELGRFVLGSPHGGAKTDGG